MAAPARPPARPRIGVNPDGTVAVPGPTEGYYCACDRADRRIVGEGGGRWRCRRCGRPALVSE